MFALIWCVEKKINEFKQNNMLFSARISFCQNENISVFDTDGKVYCYNEAMGDNYFLRTCLIYLLLIMPLCMICLSVRTAKCFRYALLIAQGLIGFLWFTALSDAERVK